MKDLPTHTADINTRVYRETTLPINDVKKSSKFGRNSAAATANTNATAATTNNVIIKFKNANSKTPTTTQKPNKPKRRDKSDLGEHFIAPDGGWAWIVCIAAGVSNLSIYPCLQQFGFLFRERLAFLGMSSSQVTTIINTNPAISACTGLLNGPMFRRYTFRQVAIAGSLCMFVSLLMTAYVETFFGYMMAYSLLFGFGMGISVSASSLAINTYFKNKRRRAAGFSWTITGLGPIFLPYVVTGLLTIYGVQGTVIIFAAVSLHSLVCALTYQPVRNHAPQQNIPEANDEIAAEKEYMCQYCERRQRGLFSSQYLYQDDDADRPGYEIIEPGTPMLSRANDGWYGSKLSLSSGKMRFRTVSSSKDLEVTGRLNKVISEEELKTDEFLKPNYFKREHDEAVRRSCSRNNLRLQIGRTDSSNQLRCTCTEEKALLELTQQQPLLHNNVANNTNSKQPAEEQLAEKTEDITFLRKVVTFFDLDLLRDFTFTNLVMGLTIINFGELNFSILTPFILNDFGFDTAQITLAMSVLGGLDITMRFLVPFITEHISWDNRVFFLIGVVGIALGRTVVACTRSYALILCCFAWIGVCKGVRTIFWPLIIPGYVPLKRLPAASGLQLLITGLFSLACGPFVGLVRDRYDYSVCLHCLNMMSFIAAISWSLEALVRRYYRNKRKRAMVAAET